MARGNEKTGRRHPLKMPLGCKIISEGIAHFDDIKSRTQEKYSLKPDRSNRVGGVWVFTISLSGPRAKPDKNVSRETLLSGFLF
jgi:hypothetical protein